MHTDYAEGKPGPLESKISTENLDVWLRLGRDAIAGRKRAMVTHSEIFPGTFASTTETADYLVAQLGLTGRAVLEVGAHGDATTQRGPCGQVPPARLRRKLRPRPRGPVAFPAGLSQVAAVERPKVFFETADIDSVGRVVISLKKYIAGNDTERELMRVIQLLIQGIGLHAVEGDPEAYSGFRQGIDQVLTKVDEAASAADFLPQARSALKLLEDHNRRTTIYLKQKAVELQSMVRMLTAAVGAISAAGDENVRQLRDIEQQVESASQIEDMRLVKAKLGECLSQIRREAERQRTETGRTVEQLNQSLESAQPAKPPAAGTDPVTGCRTANRPRTPGQSLPGPDARLCGRRPDRSHSDLQRPVRLRGGGRHSAVLCEVSAPAVAGQRPALPLDRYHHSRAALPAGPARTGA